MIVSGLLHVRPDHVKPLSRLTSFEQFVCLLSWGGECAVNGRTGQNAADEAHKRLGERKKKNPPVLANHRGEQPPNHHIGGLDGQSEAEREAEGGRGRVRRAEANVCRRTPANMRMGR